MKISMRNILLLSLLFIGIFGELGFQTFWKNSIGNYKSPAAWLGFGLLACMAAWVLLLKRKSTIPTIENLGKLRINRSFSLAVFLLMSVITGFRLAEFFAEFEISQYNSDIVPSIQLYVRRLLSGEYPYTPLVFDGWTVLPTYFPMMWLPYVFSEVADIDYRWTAYLVFLGSLALYLYRISKQNIPTAEIIFKTLLPFLFIIIFIDNDKGVFGHAVELLPIGFYLFLCFSLFHKRAKWLFAVAIVFCLLSRYAFTLWLPLTMLIYWAEFGFKSVLRVSLLVFAGVLVIYIIPFLSKDWDLVINGLKYYEKTAIRQWDIQAWQAVGEKPYHLFQGLSFSAWFYDNIEGDSLAKMSAAQTAHGIASFAAAALLALAYLFMKKFRPNWNVRLFLLVGLKFYLLIFYGFIYVPFVYLFMLPLFISLALIYEIPLWATIQGKEEELN